ncbi:unnamed protein product [Ceutorhynchus assimilis]|uniref:Carbohydrate kinase FGGY N-terminal domain-containing protein n=1 Tax=Ceutorhynchus assimilis TaxID=467358 RepID=A0A9N9MM16_9CUCU|nr:unnamed protein product [Ceutorhynchus assimilis]
MAGDSLGYIAALDIGTTTIRCQIIDNRGSCKGSSFDKINLHYPDPGSVEIDPDELWESVVLTVLNAIKGT